MIRQGGFGRGEGCRALLNVNRLNLCTRCSDGGALQTQQNEALRVISRSSLRIPGLGPLSEYFLATSTRYLDEIACRIY